MGWRDQVNWEDSNATLTDALSKARAAAAAAGVSMATTHGEDGGATVSPHGRTSFAFTITGLENAASVGEIETYMADTLGVQIRIIYATATAWVSAPRELDPNTIIDHFAAMGFGAELTDSSLRRRRVWSDVEEGRSARSERRQRLIRHSTRRKPVARRVMEEERKALEQARREGFLDEVKPKVQAYQPHNVLFTARELITRGRLLVALVFGVPVVVLAAVPALQFDYWQWLCAVLSLPVVVYSAYPFHRALAGGLRRGMSALDGATSMAVVAAYLWSLCTIVLTEVGAPSYRAGSGWVAISPTNFVTGELFFDVACLMTLLLLAGRLVVRITRASLLEEMQVYKPHPNQPVTVVTKNRKTGEVTSREVPWQKLNVGDDVLVPPMSIVPVDGVIVGGSATLTCTVLGIGELPVKVNDMVYAGCLTSDKVLKVRVTATGHRTWLAAIYRWVGASASRQNASDALATKTASVLVPIAFGVAVCNFGMWALITGDFSQAFATSLAVLGCVAPVAVAVSSSVANRLGIENAARKGVLIKDAETVRRLDSVDTVIFNRVGALSEGDMHVDSVMADRGENAELVLRVAGALSMESDHPVSRALVKAARESRDHDTSSTIPAWVEVSQVDIDEEGAFTGMVEIPLTLSDGTVELRPVEATLWRPRKLSDVTGRLATAIVSGGTPLVVSWKGKNRGVITLRDEAKADAMDSVDLLEGQGIETMMLSRDTYPVARAYGDSVGVSHVLAGIRPSAKAQAVRSVCNHGHQVAMVGDDSVDACFKVADVGVLVGAMRNVPDPADLDSLSADVVLLDAKTAPIPWLFSGSRRLTRLVRRNLIIAWGYNTVAVVLACAGVLHPLVATIAMLAGSMVIELRSMLARTY